MDDVRVGHLLVAGEICWQASHIAGALYIVLAPQRVDAAAWPAQFTGHHGQVGKAHDAFCAGGMLCYAQTVYDGRLAGACVHPGSLYQVLLTDVADLGHLLRGIIL